MVGWIPQPKPEKPAPPMPDPVGVCKGFVEKIEHGSYDKQFKLKLDITLTGSPKEQSEFLTDLHNSGGAILMTPIASW